MTASIQYSKSVILETAQIYTRATLERVSELMKDIKKPSQEDCVLALQQALTEMFMSLIPDPEINRGGQLRKR